jgi:phosphoribosyl 1,2-cyclic phosphodiesterase
MRLWTLGSGSKGNAVLIECGDTRVLIDAGFSARRIGDRLAAIGVDPRSICALLLTHEHRDHVCGLESTVKRWNWPVHLTAGTARAEAQALAGATTHVVACGETFAIGTLSIAAVRTSHDASDPVGFVATSQRSGMRMAIVTDLGVVTNPVREAIRDADVLVVESNHDEVMLQTGPYPYHLKRRVAGNQGHLSNRAAGELVAESMHRGLQQVVLAHLSETNNTPAMALEAMRGVARKTRYKGVLSAAPQHDVAGPFGDAAGLGGQLTLF